MAVIPLISTGGSPYAIGFDVGTAMADQIRAAAASTRADFARAGDGGALGRVSDYVDATEREAPDLLEEIRGMAEGSGVSFDDLFVLNAAAELHQSAGRFSECTVAGITQAGTANGHVLLAHNEDADAGWGDYAYLVRAEPDNGPAFVAFTYAGLLLHQGVNAAGIGSVGNALYAPDARRGGIPKLLLYRRAIAQSTLEDAIRVVTDESRAYGNNHLFTNSEGDLFDVEVSGEHWGLIHAGNRFLVHANHFTHQDLLWLDEESDLLNSRLRQARLERLIDADWGSITVTRLREMMADHANYPKSLCKHSAPESGLDYGTIGSVVIDVTDRVLWACAGNPCRAEWREVRI